MESLLDDVHAVVTSLQQGEGRAPVTIRPYRTRVATARHQVVVIFKPELCRECALPGGRSFLRELLSRLDAHYLEPGAVVAMPGEAVRASRLVRRHYALLHDVARRGLSALRPGALAAVRETFRDHGGESGDVMGGYEFLDRYPDFTPRALDLLVQNLEVHKLAAGVYACKALIDGDRVILLNGFHPAQVEHFERPASVTVLMECVTSTPLRRLRSNVIGSTDPAQASPDSVRGWLASRRDAIGWKLSTGLNAIHTTPGTVEAMFAVQQYFGVDGGIALSDTVLGARLQGLGFPLPDVAALAENPDVDCGGGARPLFDATEDLDVDDAIEVLRLALDDGTRV